MKLVEIKVRYFVIVGLIYNQRISLSSIFLYMYIERNMDLHTQQALVWVCGTAMIIMDYPEKISLLKVISKNSKVMPVLELPLDKFLPSSKNTFSLQKTSSKSGFDIPLSCFNRDQGLYITYYTRVKLIIVWVAK